MGKAQRLIQLMMKVNERKSFTIQEMADECGVSRRTMIRDLMELSELGVPLYSEVGVGGGYRMLRDKVLPPINFTEYEAIALFFAGQSLRNYQALPFTNEVEQALDKLFHYLPNERKEHITQMRQRLVFWIPPHELETPFLQPLLEAAIQQQLVSIVYESSKIKNRTIQPIGVYTMNGLWYCQAYCFSSLAYRVFRVDRVKQLSTVADQSQKLDLDHEHIETWIMKAETDQKLDVEVELTMEGVRRCQSELSLANHISVRANGTGVLCMQWSRSSLNWLVHFFLGLGLEATVKKPELVRKQIQAKLQQMARQYE